MEALLKCESCGGLLDEEDLFCAECGTEAPSRGQSSDRPGTAIATHSFECKSCGAQMTYDAQAQSLRCPYCDSVDVIARRDQRVLAPWRAVPFSSAQLQAVEAMREWLGRGFWRPGDLATVARVDRMTAVYVPYWMFRARTRTFWTADTSQTPPGARGDWFPMFGSHQGEHQGLLVPASSVLTMEETAAISPFDLSTALPPQQVDTAGAAVEQFAVARKYARPIARHTILAAEAAECRRRYVPGRCRNLKVNVVVEDMFSEPVQMPVWVMAYRYRDRVYRFLLNGQTGRATGQAPISYRKIAAAIALGIAALLLVALLLSLR